MNIELEAAFQTIALRQDDRLPALFYISGEVKSGSDGQLGNHHVTGQQSGIGTAGQPEVRVGGGTYTRGITQANAMRGRAKIEEKRAVPALVSRGAGEGDGAAAGGAAEVLDLKAVAIE